MTKERKKQLVEDIIASIVCSEVWDKEQAANPEIAVSTAKMEALLNAARQYVPEDLMRELECAIYQYAGAYERASLLNGLHAADALRDVTAHPSDYTDLIAKKLKGQRGEGSTSICQARSV